jgi:hypothetical protein
MYRKVLFVASLMLVSTAADPALRITGSCSLL